MKLLILPFFLFLFSQLALGASIGVSPTSISIGEEKITLLNGGELPVTLFLFPSEGIVTSERVDVPAKGKVEVIVKAEKEGTIQIRTSSQLSAGLLISVVEQKNYESSDLDESLFNLWLFLGVANLVLIIGGVILWKKKHFFS